jgi:hypothetical protein
MSTTNNNIYTRNNLKWSPTEDKRLETLYTKQKLNFKAIATDLHRSVDAIQARFVKQYLAHKYSPKYMLENKEALANKYKIDNASFTRYLKYAGIREEDIRKTRHNNKEKTSPTQKKVKYEIEEYNNDDADSDSSDATWNPSEEDDDSSSCTSCSSDSSYSSDSSDDSSDTSSDSSDDEEETEDHQYHINKYIIQKQRERVQMQTDIANIMKTLEALHEKIDRLDKKYK